MIVIVFKFITRRPRSSTHLHAMSSLTESTAPHHTTNTTFDSDKIQTDRSPLIQAFPWSTGIPLASDRTKYLKDALEDKGVPEELMDSLMVSNCSISSE